MAVSFSMNARVISSLLISVLLLTLSCLLPPVPCSLGELPVPCCEEAVFHFLVPPIASSLLLAPSHFSSCEMWWEPVIVLLCMAGGLVHEVDCLAWERLA